MGRWDRRDEALNSEKSIKDIQGPKWYRAITADGVYYSPFLSGKRLYTFIGDGNGYPTPKETAEFLNTNRGADVVAGGKLFSVWNPISDETDLEEVPGGTYRYEEGNSRDPERLVHFPIRNDNYAILKDRFDEVDGYLSRFLDNEDLYRNLGTIYKLGLLFYGEPGNSKTSALRRYISSLVKNENAIVIYVGEEFPSGDFLTKVNHTLKNRLKVFIFEELATNIDEWYVGRLLDFLDGETSIDRCIVFATTNYPEKIPGNIVDRPSRFDKLIKFGNPVKREREVLFEYFLGSSASPEIITSSEGMSVAAIKESCISSLLSKTDISICVNEMKARSKLCKKSFADSKYEMGF